MQVQNEPLGTFPKPRNLSAEFDRRIARQGMSWFGNRGRKRTRGRLLLCAHVCTFFLTKKF